MAKQYDVLGKAPGLEELNKLSPNNVCCPKERSPALKFLFW